ncbi:MAG: hypothetical protein A2020_13415 [Lentisphaerae bacterium GWF2_45_14]|nr:MAG: hypothetical protein A2020_13415 [Lentisphaerae bacterium GWF2_45_14]
MNSSFLNELISQEESEFLDFKEKYHLENLKLLHDILCLANAFHDGDRFLVFGIKDSPKKIVGIENDLKRKTSANIQDLLRQSNFNRIPTVRLETIKKDGHEIDVLVIENRPDKPFFLLKDKEEGRNTIRNGVIYTRLGDTNIPLRETTSEVNIELMWRERFGFGLPPLKLMYKFIENPGDWEKIQGVDNYIYYRERPEFIIEDGKILNPSFSESWTKTFHDATASSFEVRLCYLNTLLLKVTFVHCDGGRYRIPLPKIENNGFYICEDSIEWKIAQIYWQDYQLNKNKLKQHGIILI